MSVHPEFMGRARKPSNLKDDVNGSPHVRLPVKWSPPKGINFEHVLAELCSVSSTAHVRSLVKRSKPKGINFRYVPAELCFVCSTPRKFEQKFSVRVEHPNNMLSPLVDTVH